MNSLPMTIRVDPEAAVTRLLTDLRDQALDMAAYEWVSTGQIHQWSGRRADEKLVESLIVFENYPRGSDDLSTALAAQGISVELPDAAGSQTAFPVTLLAYRDVDGSLVLAAVHDRARLADEDAARLVGQCARLLRDLPDLADGPATVTDVLAALDDEPPVRMADAPAPDGTGDGDAAWPEGPEADLVKEAWRAVFGTDDVAPGTHFFDAGGHSLLAVRLLRELAGRTGRTLRLDDLLAHPRAGQLAALLAAPAPRTPRTAPPPSSCRCGPPTGPAPAPSTSSTRPAARSPATRSSPASTPARTPWSASATPGPTTPSRRTCPPRTWPSGTCRRCAPPWSRGSASCSAASPAAASSPTRWPG
ncbi:hypothetical protein DN402_05730 [Streptomyces sp. SW4]|nr:hypothetical protein DN402_05730 [Streptomyces sp. SW4]